MTRTYKVNVMMEVLDTVSVRQSRLTRLAVVTNILNGHGPLPIEPASTSGPAMSGLLPEFSLARSRAH